MSYPVFITSVHAGLGTAQKPVGCESGARASGRLAYSARAHVVRLEQPAEPALNSPIRFGRVSPPGSTEPALERLHGFIANGDRIHLAYGVSQTGVLQIVGKTKLINGNPAVRNRFAST